jgi:hypothetical protein
MRLLKFQRTILFQKLLEVQINPQPKMRTDKAVAGMLMLGEMLEQPRVLADSIKLCDQDIKAICASRPAHCIFTFVDGICYRSCSRCLIVG